MQKSEKGFVFSLSPFTFSPSPFTFPLSPPLCDRAFDRLIVLNKIFTENNFLSV
ncbi:hypothetical protein FDUTEX481_07471 [Tolypothrix sp. PCC 7601]|nr:hypothetical protein FDUTEX481_07471 [Tolypothrix sp. PCC 7601]